MRLRRRINLSVAETAERVCLLGQTDCGGAARLPALALHSLMRILVREAARYSGCALLPLRFQEAAGRSAGLIGDIHISDPAGILLEGYAVLPNIPIADGLLQDFHEKLSGTAALRYYLLTADRQEDYAEFNPYIDRIARFPGCQLAIDSFDRTFRHYLQLIKNPAEFVDAYASRLETDPAISPRLKPAWDEIIAG